jgi:hypothetical protein
VISTSVYQSTNPAIGFRDFLRITVMAMSMKAFKVKGINGLGIDDRLSVVYGKQESWKVGNLESSTLLEIRVLQGFFTNTYNKPLP